MKRGEGPSESGKVGLGRSRGGGVFCPLSPDKLGKKEPVRKGPSKEIRRTFEGGGGGEENFK